MEGRFDQDVLAQLADGMHGVGWASNVVVVRDEDRTEEAVALLTRCPVPLGVVEAPGRRFARLALVDEWMRVRIVVVAREHLVLLRFWLRWGRQCWRWWRGLCVLQSALG